MLALMLLMAPVAALSQGGATPGFDDEPRSRYVEEPDWFKASFLDLREDLELAVRARGKRGLIVYFHQEDCAYCEALIEVNFADEDIARYTREHFDVVSIDIWAAARWSTPRASCPPSGATRCARRPTSPHR